MPTILLEQAPAGFRFADDGTNLVHWLQPSTNGDRAHAMPYPLFVRAVFAGLAFIEQTNETRERAAIAARDEARRNIIPLHQGLGSTESAAGDHAAAP
jgi:hypothetical protein